MKHVCAGVSAGVIFAFMVVMPGLVWSYPYRKPSFQDTILRRCCNYDPPPDAPLRVDKDCKKIAEAFTKAVASKNASDIRAEDYQPLMELVNEQNFPCDKVLFWSKTYDLAHSHKGQLLTLEDMLVGSIADGLMWCGDKSSSEVQYGPYQEMNGICHGVPTRVFWIEAAKWFAENACGKVRVLLNGTNKESIAYSIVSVFGTGAVPNLSSAVTELKACVIHDSEAGDSCSGASIKQLKLDLRRNITFTCEHTNRKSFPACLKNRGVSQSKSVLWDSGVIGLIVALLLSINLPDLGATLVGSLGFEGSPCHFNTGKDLSLQS